MAHRENSLDSIMSTGTREKVNDAANVTSGVSQMTSGKKLVPNPKFNQNAATNNIFNNPVRPQEASYFRDENQKGVTEESSKITNKNSSYISKRISNSITDPSKYSVNSRAQVVSEQN